MRRDSVNGRLGILVALWMVGCGTPDPTDAGIDGGGTVDDGGPEDSGPSDSGPSDSGPSGLDAGSGGAVGEPCADGADCASGICFPAGFGTGVCTEACTTSGDCVDGWTCDAFGAGMACSCESTAERCDGLDNNCDGRVDEGRPATIGCGEGELCDSGACTCPAGRMCGAECVDTDADPANCGGCGVACGAGDRCAEGSCCTPSTETCNGMDDDCDGAIDEGSGSALGCAAGESCSAGSCACDEMCGGATCVDLSRDSANCGSCGTVCGAGLECLDSVCCEGAGSRVDVLFMVDNSNSMTEEQTSLTEQLPRMVQVLATGDLDGDGIADRPPVRDLHLGVVTSDMGTGGFTVPTCADPVDGDDGVLRIQGNTSIAGCGPNYPSFVSFVPGVGDVATTAADFSCVAAAGIGGCGFEQQLEAVLKAVTPSSSPLRFFRATSGHADGANAGFLRDDSVLVTFLLTDENDCSAAVPDLFNPSSPTYGATDLNLRCFAHPGALHPLTRYVDGLLASRADPADLIFAAVTGVPVDLIPSSGTPDFSRILADPRMVERVDGPGGGSLVPACDVPGRGVAYAGRRQIRVAQELEARGATGIIGSICQADLSDPMDAVLNRITARLSESCASAP